MQRIKISNGHDRTALRAALDARGFGAVQIIEGEAGLYLDVPDDVDALAVDEAVRSLRSADAVIAALAAMDLEGVSTLAGLKEQIKPIRDAAAAVVGSQE